MADSIAISVVAKVAEYLVDPLLRPAISCARFLFCAGKIKTNLESTKMELMSKQESVMEKKEEALIRTEIIDKAVELWLMEVTEIMKEVERLQEEMKEDSSCCWGRCSTRKGYNLCKQFAEITESMKRLNQVREFNPFSCRAPIPDIEFFPSGNFVYFESTKLASKQLLEALREDSVNMVGLYGMGGCGKTTLVIEVGKKAKELELFNHVVFTTVSQSVDVRKIQGEVADLLSFKFASETEAGRARELSMRLKSGERILVVLDDVWTKHKLEDIGIPLHNNHKGCKVLLTTRRQQVCTSMECERMIPLSLLSDEEAWNLFQKNIHIVDESVAKEITRECKGLPIAIVAIAKSLKGRPLDSWRFALRKLKTSKPVDVDEDERNVYSCLELSYNYLNRKEAKLLLKICSMFPEDHMIPLEKLFRYGIGLGICEEEDSFEDARHTVNVAIDDLIDSSLLLPCGDLKKREFFKIHDMVRDVTLWITSKEDGIIMVDPEKNFSAIVENGSIQDCYAFSLWHKEIDQIPQSLAAPKLQVLLLSSWSYLDFPIALCEGMKELKLMSLVSICPRLSLPISAQWLENLHTLRLEDQWNVDISFVISLRRLKILDLNRSRLKKLPNGIENMKELKLLDLSSCKIEEDFSEIIGRCSQLAELYITPGVALHYKCFLPKTFPKLQRYCFEISDYDFPWYGEKYQIDDAREFRYVKFGGLNISNSCATVKHLLQRVVTVSLDRLVGGSKSIIPELVVAAGTLNELNKLYLGSCSEIECIIDTSDHAYSFRVNADLPKLVQLELWDMNNLTEVVHGPLSPLRVFEKLEYLKIRRCNKLRSLFQLSIAQSLQQLEELFIEFCSELEHIITKGETEKNETDATEKEIFPNLKTIRILSCNKLEYVLPNSGKCCELKHIIVNEGESATATQNCPVLMFPKLKDMSDCNKLEFNHQNLEQGQPSSSMGSDVFMANANQPSNEVSVHHIGKLECLEFVDLPALSFIWMGPLMLQYLCEIEIKGCGKLKSIFSSAIHNSFPELTKLKISDCEDLEEIMTENEESQKPSGSQPCFPKLRVLKVTKCNKLKSLFTLSIALHLSQLKTLYISEAAQLEQAFICKNEDVTCDVQNILLPNLKFLILEKLPNFVDICFSLKLHAVKLQWMAVCECPRGEINKWCTETLINSQNLEGLWLKDLPELVLRWKAPTLINFKNLVILIVVACRKLKFIFPACAVRSLPKLTDLVIKHCEELERVFDYASEMHNYDGEVMELALPKLRGLGLICLPNFSGFGGDLEFHLKFQVLEKCKVRDCPKLPSTTIATLETFLLGNDGHNSDNNDTASYSSSESQFDDFLAAGLERVFDSSSEEECDGASDDVNSHVESYNTNLDKKSDISNNNSDSDYEESHDANCEEESNNSNSCDESQDADCEKESYDSDTDEKSA